MKLNYRELGEGLPLLILHGLYGSSDNWISIARSLSSTYRIILPDQRNHGKSEHSAEHSYGAMAKDIKELCDQLEIKKLFIAGHSMGGKTAMRFAMEWPEMILGLTIIDISPFKPENENNTLKEFHKTVLIELSGISPEKLKSREEADSILSNNIHSGRIRSFLLKNLSRDKTRNFSWKLNPQILLDNLDNILEGNDRSPSNIEMNRGYPVTFVRAENSGYIPDSDLELIELMYPVAEIITVPDTSHWIHAEKPEVVIDILMNQVE